MFMSDSRSRRVRDVNVAARRRSPFGSLAFIGGAAVLALALVATFALMRGGRDGIPAASATGSTVASAPSSTDRSASPSSATAGGVRPDAEHGVITFQNIRTEADPRDLQQVPQFIRNGRSDFTVGVSPDGTRVAMIRSGETGQQLITFTTTLPDNVTIVLGFSGEAAGGVVWAGDGVNSLLIAVSKIAASSGGPQPTFEYSTLRVVDLGTKQVREIARITNGSFFQPLAWRSPIAAAAEIGAAGRAGSYDLVRESARTDVSPERTPLTNVFVGGITASRDGTRIAAVAAPAVRWWPIDQPGAAKELLADSRGRAEYAEFRPGKDELGVRVAAATTALGVPPPGHFEIWSLSGPQRGVSPTAGFSRWRVDGTAALDATNLVDPDTGAVTPLPGGAFKIVDVVRFGEPVTPSRPTALPAAPATAPPGAQSPATEVSLNGRTFHVANAYLWRDFMPISEPGGKPLAASVKIQVDSGTFPVDVTVDHVWVYGPTVWEPAQFEVRRSPDAGTPADQLEVFANGGPKWDPGTQVSVEVRVLSGSTTRVLRVTGVTIQKTS
jgi:hypothetical protein